MTHSKNAVETIVATIVIPVRDDPRIRICVESLLKQTTNKKYKIVVVNNNSKKINVNEILNDLSVTILYEPRPGLCAAVNCGIKHSIGEFLVRIDADCIADTNWLEELIAPFSDAKIGAVGGAIIKEEGFSLVEKASRNLVIGDQLSPQYLPMFNAPYVVTANAAYRCSLIKDLGEFDEELFSGGDVDMSWRISMAGYTIQTTPKAIVWHPARSTIRRYFKQFYIYALGHVLLFRKYKKITGKRFSINLYPFSGTIRLLYKEIPSFLFDCARKKSFDKAQAMSIFLNFIEYAALQIGYLVGSCRYHVLFI